jgi:hypothetical protein
MLWLVRLDAVINYDQGTRNQVVAERFVDTATPRAVIVGSSLAYRLAPDYMGGDFLGPNVFNLALAGGSPLTGLEIVLQKAELPDVVFVETNIIVRAYDASFVTQLFKEPARTLRRLAPAFRLENRPIDVTIALLSKGFRRVLDSVGWSPTEQVFASEGDTSTQAEGRSFTSVGAEELQDQVYVDANLGLLGQQVDGLREKNVRVILVHSPSIPGSMPRRLHATSRRN